MIMLLLCVGLLDNTVQQSPSICMYCGSADHSSAHCHNRPCGNREQPRGTPDTLRNEQNQLADTEILGNKP